MILARLAELGRRQTQHAALQDADTQVGFAELHAAVTATAAVLKRSGISTLGLLLDNSPAWVIMDLAALHAGICVVPVPAFFSAEQIDHVIRDAGIDTLCTDSAHAESWAGFTALDSPLPHTVLLRARQTQAANRLPASTAKVTFTSGTTGHPKGVCLSASAMHSVAESIVTVTSGLQIEKHLCLLPLALLLENICGVYAPLLAGATIVLPGARDRGLQGSQQLDIRQMLKCLHESQPHSLVLVPQMLKALTVAVSLGMALPNSLRFVAVGGARVSPALLHEAREAGIPVYEGYGLSECSSVVALNRPGDDLPGSAGKPLPHARIRIAEGGEIQVSGATMLGYAGQQPQPGNWFATGDLGFIDSEGFLHLTGRIKNAFITAYGRNVNPEWPESELTRFPEISHAVVFGEAMEHNVAVIQTASSTTANEAVAACVHAANDLLPDYARIKQWVRAAEDFSSNNGLLTASGKPRRDAVWEQYQGQFAATSDLNIHDKRGIG